MKRAFTLIELVVVIAIIGIIAAVLFPIFAQPNGHRKRGSCLSNVKQLSGGLMMYTLDYDGVFPPAEKWMTVSEPYTKNPALVICPVAQKDNPKAKSSYAMDTRLSEKSQAKVKEPASRVFFYDSTRTDGNAADPGQTFAPRHSEKGNVVFADGHAKEVPTEQFLKYTR